MNNICNSKDKTFPNVCKEIESKTVPLGNFERFNVNLKIKTYIIYFLQIKIKDKLLIPAIFTLQNRFIVRLTIKCLQRYSTISGYH